jgi:hypothetical protein
MQSYVDCLNPKGTLLLSGLYEDIPLLMLLHRKGLKYVKSYKGNNFTKIRKLAINPFWMILENLLTSFKIVREVH